MNMFEDVAPHFNWCQSRKKQHIETREEKDARFLGMQIWRISEVDKVIMEQKRWHDSLKYLMLAYQKEKKMRDSYIRALELLNNPDEAYPKLRPKLTPKQREERKEIRKLKKKEYQKRPEVKERLKQIRNRPEVKAKKSEYDRKLREAKN